MKKLIGIQHYPGDKKSKAHLDRYYCNLGEEYTCPLLENGQCIHRLWMESCVYGESSRETGYTKNAYSSGPKWNARARDVVTAGPPDLDYANPKQITYIGEYVWLPYPFMNHEDGQRLGIKFTSFSSWLSSGKPFMKREDFTPEMVVLLCKLRPQALMGGEIKDYQQKHLPRFLYDLGKVDPDLLQAAIEINPAIEQKLLKPADLKNARARISNVTPGTKVSLDDRNIAGTWDGEHITFTGKNNAPIHMMFKKDDMLEIKLVVKPKPDMLVIVLDEEELARLFEAEELVLS